VTELFLCAAPKDYNKIPWALQGVADHIPEITTAHVVTPDPLDFTNLTRLEVRKYTDYDVLQFPHDIFPYRANWIFQQFLKLFQNVTEDEYLVIDADTIILRDLELHLNGKPVFMLGRDQPEGAYHEFNQIILGTRRPYPHSLISECTLYQRHYIWEMLRKCGAYSIDRFAAWTASIIDVLCHPAESELYGAYVYSQHPDAYVFRQLEVCMNGRYNSAAWERDEIMGLVVQQQDQADILSIHTWEGNV